MVKFEEKPNLLITLSKVKNPDEELYSRIKDFLLESQASYPSIGEWWETRVVPGLKTGERVCQAVVTNSEIAALSIIKHSHKSSKLCTLRVSENYRSLGFGQRLLRRTLENLLSHRCKEVHYTISDEVMSYCGDFFTPYGFYLYTWNKGKYVKGRDELVFSVQSRRLLNRLTIAKINQATNMKVVCFSIRPKYADLIERGWKRVEFRRKCSANLNSSVGFFYVTSPVKEIRFVALIERVIKSKPSILWSQFKDESGVDYRTFCKYFAGASEGTALVLSDVHSLRKAVTLDELRLHQVSFSPPQSYKFLSQSDGLCELISKRELINIGF